MHAQVWLICIKTINVLKRMSTMFSVALNETVALFSEKYRIIKSQTPFRQVLAKPGLRK